MTGNSMDNALYYTLFETDMGWVGILGSSGGLLRTTLPGYSRQQAENLMYPEFEQAVYSPKRFQDLAERLRNYFSGGITSFPDTLDISSFTPFRRLVWETTRRIPYGETRSYLWVAQQMDRPLAYRAAGQALGKNPFPIIVPCHRVVAADGSLGGFSGGLDIKKALLRLEASAIH